MGIRRFQRPSLFLSLVIFRDAIEDEENQISIALDERRSPNTSDRHSQEHRTHLSGQTSSTELERMTSDRVARGERVR